jgi:outer membrane protein assembly factor BamE (lipoprotein component of BamABCDE complex)
MDRKVVSLAAALCVMSLGACAPQIASNGIQPVDNKPQDVKVGADTRSTVLSKLGSPSAVATFDPNVWYYISQTTEQYAYYKPHVQKRTVVSIAFDKDEKVTAVNDLALKDGFQVAFANQQTPTRGKELNWLQQILGTIGRGGGMLNQNQQDPGQRPGQGR